MSGCTAFVELLSARIDGELKGAHAGQLEEHLAGCASCRARELALLAQGAALRTQAARKLEMLEATGAIDLAGFSARVMRAAQRDAHRPSRWEHLKLALRERWEHQRLRFSASIGLATAACAAVTILFATPLGFSVRSRPGFLSASEGSSAMLRASNPAPEPQVLQASVDSVELMAGTTGAVFEVPGQTTVIWVSDETTE